jgi:Cysteine-rich secretory protein family
MRKLAFGLIVAIGVAFFPAGARADTVTDESAFVAKINDLRASKGLGALQVNGNLVAKARSWATTMAAGNRIWHSTLSDGITADWQKLGENVGMGGSVDGLHNAFVASPHHYENLVDPSFTQVGIGIAMNGDTIFVAEEFMQLMPAKAPVVAPVTAPVKAVVASPTTTTAPRPPAPKPVRVKPLVPSTTTTTAAAPPPPPPAPPAVTPASDPGPAAGAATPAEPSRAPSDLLVSVLERLRNFDA